MAKSQWKVRIEYQEGEEDWDDTISFKSEAEAVQEYESLIQENKYPISQGTMAITLYEGSKIVRYNH